MTENKHWFRGDSMAVRVHVAGDVAEVDLFSIGRFDQETHITTVGDEMAQDLLDQLKAAEREGLLSEADDVE